MPACGEVNRAMQELTSVSYNSGEQNKDITQARQSRDWKDTQTLLIYLLESRDLQYISIWQYIDTPIEYCIMILCSINIEMFYSTCLILLI